MADTACNLPANTKIATPRVADDIMAADNIYSQITQTNSSRGMKWIEWMKMDQNSPALEILSLNLGKFDKKITLICQSMCDSLSQKDFGA